MTAHGNAAGGSRRLTELPNGVRVISDAMESVESVSLGAWFSVGTRNEEAHVNGVAHFLEHMAFKGTKRRGATEIAEAIEAVGGHLNAYTSREQTAYYAKVLKEDTGLVVEILADILQNSTFDDVELARERAVILQEIGQASDTPDDAVFDRFQEAAYPDQALGWPVLGRADVVTEMPRSAIVDFIAQHYGARQLVFSAAGKVDHDKLVADVEAGFGNLAPRPDAPVAAARYTGGESRVERDLEQAHLVLGFPGVNFHDPDFYAQQVYSTILGGGMSSRLFQEVRERRGLAYSIYSFTAAYHDAGLIGIYAGTGEQNVPELVPVVCAALSGFADSDLDAEVRKARTQLKSGLLMSREGTSNRCEQMAQHLLVFGHVVEVAEMVDRIDSIDVEAVRRIARRTVGSPPTIAAIGPLSRLEPYDTLLRRLS